MTPNEYADKLQKATEEADWHVSDDLLHAQCQQFASDRDWDAAELFYAEVLSAAGTPELVATVDSTLGELSAFSSAVARSYSEAVERASRDPEVRAIYFEYFYDGGDASDGNFFLCTEYSQDSESDWAAYFTRDGVISGPSVQKLLNFDPDIELGEPEGTAAYNYAHARLLAAFGRVVCATQLRLPVAFAAHDGPIVHL